MGVARHRKERGAPLTRSGYNEQLSHLSTEDKAFFTVQLAVFFLHRNGVHLISVIGFGKGEGGHDTAVNHRAYMFRSRQQPRR